MSDSPILCSIDLDAPGKQVGRLQVPRSSNQSGWSNQYVPIVSVARGEGPTALVLGGVHGDEPEGQVAALNLARELLPEQVSGRVIVIPCVSIDASRAYTCLWPSGANMNRSFPGSPAGRADEQLAHFLPSVPTGSRHRSTARPTASSVSYGRSPAPSRATTSSWWPAPRSVRSSSRTPSHLPPAEEPRD